MAYPQLLKNGARAAMRCGEVVLAIWTKAHGIEYITWVTDEIGNCFWGHYFLDAQEAIEDFNARIRERGITEQTIVYC